MGQRLLRWVWLRKNQLILSVLCVTVVELWKLDHEPYATKHVPSFELKNGDGLLLMPAVEDAVDDHIQDKDGTGKQSDKRTATAADDHLKLQAGKILADTSGPVVNPHPFKYVINCPDLCSPNEPVFLLNYVHTAVDHFNRRRRIRRTWAQQSTYSDVTIKTVFFVGLTDKSAWLQDALEYEAKHFRDIVQEDFLDTYRNLSFKGVAALKWITTFCNQTTYIMKTDDDIFVNMFALLKHLKDLYTHNYRSRLIMCLVWWRMHVLREGKWGIPREQLADELYPVYCSGMGFVLTTDVAIAMYRVSYYVKFHWVDDAYISGFLPRALNGSVNHTDMSRAYCGVQEMSVYSHQTEWYKYLFTHIHDELLYNRTWSKLVDIATHTSIPTPALVRPGKLADNYISKDILFPELRKKREQRARERKRRKEKEKDLAKSIEDNT